jgi:hypothetical protein
MTRCRCAQPNQAPGQQRRAASGRGQGTLVGGQIRVQTVPAVDLARTEDRWHSCSAERPGWVLLARSRSCRARDQSQLRQHGEPAE